MPRSRARALADDFTPPIVRRAARVARDRLRSAPGGGNGKPAGPLNPDKIEYGAGFYDDSFDTDDRWRKPYWKLGWYGSWAVIADRVMSRDGAKVLDMGCGAGHLSRLLADRGLQHYVGFDFSVKRLEQARVLVPEFRFEVADASTTDLFDTVEFNTVVCTEFLEHLDGDLEILARIHSGARVLGTVPNYDAHGHVRFFDTKDEVEQRYRPSFATLSVTQVRNAGDDAEWLIDGVRP
jgi:SAM-dependent methyltransferase